MSYNRFYNSNNLNKSTSVLTAIIIVTRATAQYNVISMITSGPRCVGAMELVISLVTFDFNFKGIRCIFLLINEIYLY